MWEKTITMLSAEAQDAKLGKHLSDLPDTNILASPRTLVVLRIGTTANITCDFALNYFEYLED